MNEIEILHRVRGVNQPDLLPAGDLQSQVTGRGDQIVVIGLPQLAEVVRFGRSFSAFQTAAVAPVVALPTTSAPLSIFNGEPDGGLSYVIDDIFSIVVASAAAATGITMAHMLGTGKKVAPTAAAIVPKGLSGRVYNGRAVLALASTVVDDVWLPVNGQANQAPSINQIGSSVSAAIDGRIIVPPGHMYSIAVVANTAALITVRMGLRWHEVQLALG